MLFSTKMLMKMSADICQIQLSSKRLEIMSSDIHKMPLYTKVLAKMLAKMLADIDNWIYCHKTFL